MIARVDRFDVYRPPLTDAGRPALPDLTVHGDFTEAGGSRAMADLLAAAPDLDAVFVASDLMAVGALRTLRAAGRRVPDDVAVVAFDDAAIAATSDPDLTTMAQPVAEMVPLMIELLTRQIDGATDDTESRTCPTRLVRRASA